MKNEIKTKTNYSLNDLISDSIDELKENYKEYSDINDAITEIADSNTPIYYWDIHQYLAHNRELMFLNDEFGSFSDKETNISNLIQSNIFYAIEEKLYDYCNKKWLI